MTEAREKVLGQTRQLWLVEQASSIPMPDARCPMPDELERGSFGRRPRGQHWILASDGLDELCNTSVRFDTPVCVQPVTVADIAGLPFAVKVLDSGGAPLSIEARDFCCADPDGVVRWIVAGEFDVDQRRTVRSMPIEYREVPSRLLVIVHTFQVCFPLITLNERVKLTRSVGELRAT
ncbi:hypothetical protein [Nocardia camponoti]|uniref:Uncharacterized protein n=1 Tax=Nocardia camponoti TaxID=1616106 RepID=A0A917QQE6_9NOCA|nr:hypothetical protein [Nocardia camponoti]GGK63048.1 hypothetical protein GCM10011591_39140 [Nocardia camponoti]